MKGGRDPYLCDEDAADIEGMVVQHANQMNCLTTLQAIDIAWFLKKARQVKASDLLMSIGSDRLGWEVRTQAVERPDKSWLAGFMAKMGINVMSPEQIEQARRHSCNEKAVATFFDKFSDDLQRDKHLILNCDETHVSSRKHFKVLAPGGRAALKGCREKLPHFSAMCTISGGGYKFRPMFILPELVALPPDCRSLGDDAYFVSTGTGWMMQRAFLLYAQFLLYELKLYRMYLSMEIREQRFLLILDGHTSRWTYEAIYVLHVGGVDVLVLPAHCTHVLQIFDVSIAGALKILLAQFCEQLILTEDEFHILTITEITPESMGEKRRFILEAFLKAWSRAADVSNIEAGFLKCGIYPVNPEEPLKNKLTRKMYPGELFLVSGTSLGDMNCAMVTNSDRLDVLKAKPNKIFARHDEKVLDRKEQWCELLGDPVVSGRYLGGPNGFAWAAHNGPSVAIDTSVCLRWACQVSKPTPAVVWQVACRLAATYPILVVLLNARDCDAFSRHLRQSVVDHVTLTGALKSAARRDNWHAFQTGQANVCVGTEAALRGLTFARRIVTVYPRVPDPRTLLMTSPSNALIFFQANEHLAQLQAALIKVNLVPRSFYDTNEALGQA
jgi:hypothetical protein